MANGLKQWLALAGAGSAIVALLSLPPSRIPPAPVRGLPEVRALRSLESETRREVGILQAMLWSDSLSELAVRTAEDRVATAVPSDRQVTPEGLAAWKHALGEFVADMRPRDPDLVLGYFWQPSDRDRPVGAPSSYAGRDQTFLGVRDGTPYCLHVEPVPGISPFGDRRLASAEALLPLSGLGGCRLYVKYGLPGARIERWMEDGGFRFADGDVVPPVRHELDTLEPREWWWTIGAPVFGLVRVPVVDEYPTEGRCLSGDSDACERFLTAPEEMRVWNASEVTFVQEASPLTYASRTAVGNLFGWRERYMLADLERDFGADAFTRFWTSDADVSEAFRSAFGTELGTWVREWAQAQLGVHRRGPALRAGATLWIVLTLTLFAAVASLVGTRRRVG